MFGTLTPGYSTFGQDNEQRTSPSTMDHAHLQIAQDHPNACFEHFRVPEVAAHSIKYFITADRGSPV